MANDNILKVSHSMLASWRRCRYQFHLKYVDHYSPVEGVGRRRGTAGHAALAYWYTHKLNDMGALHVAEQTFFNSVIDIPDNDKKEFELLYLSLTRYFAWARENENLKMKKAEFEFNIPMLDDGSVVLNGYIDGIVQQGRLTWILEHKFLKIVETSHLELDPQVSIYMLAAVILGYNPAGVLYNIIRIGEHGKAESEPVLRVTVYRNMEGLETVYQEILEQAEEVGRYLRKGGNVYRNPTGDCSWDCSFYNVCLAINDDGDPDPVLKLIPKETKHGR